MTAAGFLKLQRSIITHKHKRRYTLIDTDDALKFNHLLLSPLVGTRTGTEVCGSSVDTDTSAEPGVEETTPPVCRRQHCAGIGHLPAGVRTRFGASLRVGLPHTVGELVADGRHDLEELQRPLVQVQRANPGQVGAQVPVDARALDADQGPEVKTCPVRVWMSRETDIFSEQS